MVLTARKVDLEARRETILDAALKVFEERGFYGANVPYVAKAAGVGVGTIYLHFATKEELVNALYQRCQTDYLEKVYSDFDLRMTGKEVIYEACRRVAKYTEANPTVMRFLELHQHAPYLDAESRALQRRHVERIDRYFRRGIESGEVADLPREVVVATAWGVIIGMVKLHAAGRIELTPQVAEAFGQVLWNALRNPVPDGAKGD